MSGDKSINEKEKGHTEVNKKTIFFFSDMLQYGFISRTTPWHVGKNLRFGTPHETNTLVFSVPYAKNLAFGTLMPMLLAFALVVSNCHIAKFSNQYKKNRTALMELKV